MSDSKAKRKRISKLYDAQDGLCYWCEEPMILVFPSNGIVPEKAATLDHLRDRFNPTRWAPLGPGEGSDDRVVCACAWCNGKRAKQSAKWVNPAILRMMHAVGGRLQWAAYWRRFYGTDDGLNILKAWQRPPASFATLADLWPSTPARKPKKEKLRRHLSKIKYPPLPPVGPEEQGPRA